MPTSIPFQGAFAAERQARGEEAKIRLEEAMAREAELKSLPQAPSPLEQARTMATLASAREINARVGELLDKRKKMRQMAGMASSVRLQDPILAAQDIALIAMKTGNYQLGLEAAGAVAKATTEKTVQAQHAAQTYNTALEGRFRSIELLDKQLEGVVDESTWKHYQKQRVSLGLPNPFRNVPYSPQLIDALRLQGMSMKDKLTMQNQQATTQANIMETVRRIEHIDFKEEFEQMKFREEQKAEKRGGKVGVKSAAPSQLDVEVASARLRKDFPDASDEDILAAASDLARLTNTYIAEGKDPDYAREQAFLELKKNFTTISGRLSGILPFTSAPFRDTTTYEAGSRFSPEKQPLAQGVQGKISKGTPDAPFPIPSSTKDLVPGKFYQTGFGVLQWTGTGFVPGNGE